MQRSVLSPHLLPFAALFVWAFACVLSPVCQAQQAARPGELTLRTEHQALQQTSFPVGRADRAEISAFSAREVAFGLFVLLVAFVGLLVLLPAGMKPDIHRRRERDVFH